MELQFYGANTLRITTKKARIVIDDNLKALGSKGISKDDDIALVTNTQLVNQPDKARIIIDGPGEYEVSDVAIQGIAARAHTDEKGKNAVIYRIVAEDIRVVVVGHIYPDLTEAQLEAIGVVDVLCVPVGGNGYTLDGVGALKVMKKIGPKIVIPTHYQDKSLKFEVPQATLEEGLQGLAMEAQETVPKLKLKSGDLASDLTRLIVLERQ